MKKSVWALIMLVASTSTAASELVYQFSSPSFSGIGYSSHVLTIEQLETQRRQKIKDDQQAAIDRAERERRSTNAYKFQNNLESRVYAQLSKQIADSMFGAMNNTWLEATSYSTGTVVVYNGKQYKSTSDNNTTTPGTDNAKWIANNTDWISSETPFGDNVSWKREDDRIYVRIEDSNGDTVAEFDVPVGEFAF
jgi:hypothetical protein